MCIGNKNKKISDKNKAVQKYLKSELNSEKLRCNLRLKKEPFFYARTFTLTQTLFGDFQEVRGKKKIRAKASLFIPTKKSSLRSLDTSGITAPKLPPETSKKRKKKPEKKPLKPKDDGNLSTDIRLSRKSLTKRARAKHYTDKLIKPMYHWALKNHSPLLQQYRNVLDCNTRLIQDGDTLKGSYCSNKACQVCSRIRTARLIEAYEYNVQLMSDYSGGAEFVTLSLRNVKGEQLKARVKEMIKALTLINRKLREREGVDTWGIRQLECTYNKRRNDYHPHFHIVCGKNQGELFKAEWLARFPNDADEKAQDVKEWDGNFKELFKYATKIVDVGKKSKQQKKDEVDEETGKRIVKVNLKALDTILQAFTGVRITQGFGELATIKVNEDLNKQNKAQAYHDLPENRLEEVLTVDDKGQLKSDLFPRFNKWVWRNNDWFCTVENRSIIYRDDGDFDFKNQITEDSLCGYKSNENLLYKFYEK